MAATAKILNIDMLRVTQHELLRQLRRGVLYTPNVDHLVKLQHDAAFRRAYADADWVVCDSRIVYFMSKLLKHPLPEAIPGSTFFHNFCDYHRDNPTCKIFILGGSPGVAERARDNINRRIGREIVVGTASPVIETDTAAHDDNDLILAIRRSGATVLVVCLGSPKQEIWIHRNRRLLPEVDIFMALGATVDFEANVKKRAPEIWRKCGMEWLYRFLQEPRRLFKRYFIHDPRFFYYFLKSLR